MKCEYDIHHVLYHIPGIWYNKPMKSWMISYVYDIIYDFKLYFIWNMCMISYIWYCIWYHGHYFIYDIICIGYDIWYHIHKIHNLKSYIISHGNKVPVGLAGSPSLRLHCTFYYEASWRPQGVPAPSQSAPPSRRVTVAGARHLNTIFSLDKFKWFLDQNILMAAYHHTWRYYMIWVKIMMTSRTSQNIYVTNICLHISRYLDCT